jgi:ATP-binding cassette subfamily B protein
MARLGPIRAPDRGKPPPTHRERVTALRYIPQLVKLIWETHHGLTLAMGALRLVRAFVPIATLWVTSFIIDGVVEAQRLPAPGRPILRRADRSCDRDRR